MMSSNLSTRTKDSGALGKPGSSRLIFNQEMRGFKSHTPCQLRAKLIVTTSAKCLVTLVPCRPSVWVVAQMAEHRTVTAAREGSTPFDPPKPKWPLGKRLKPPDSQSGDCRFKS